MKAEYVRDLTGFTGEAKLWKLSEPYTGDWNEDEQVQGAEYIITSATSALFSGPETYIFAANENGEVLGWGELEGSYRGGYSHEAAIEEFERSLS